MSDDANWGILFLIAYLGVAAWLLKAQKAVPLFVWLAFAPITIGILIGVFFPSGF